MRCCRSAGPACRCSRRLCRSVQMEPLRPIRRRTPERPPVLLLRYWGMSRFDLHYGYAFACRCIIVVVVYCPQELWELLTHGLCKTRCGVVRALCNDAGDFLGFFKGHGYSSHSTLTVARGPRSRTQ